MQNNTSRTVLTARNIGMNVASRGVVSLLKLVTRIIFVHYLSENLLGVNGLFADVLGMLALAELGVGSAIQYALYRPLAEKNEAKIRSLMLFYRKAYRVISGIVLALGLLLLPFLPLLVKEHASIPYFYGIYGLFLFNLAFEYFFSFRRVLAQASQNAYVLVPFTTAFQGLTALLQIGAVVLFSEKEYCYLIYVAVQSVVLIAEDITVNRYLEHRYPLLHHLNAAEKLPETEKTHIFRQVKALLLHKIGGYAVGRTDTLIISILIDLVVVGHFTNYSTLIVTVAGVAYLFVEHTTASFGNLFATSEPEKCRAVFEEMLVFDYFLYGVGSVFFITLFSPFIELAYGAKFLLPMPTVVLLVLADYYSIGMIQVFAAAKSAAGLYKPDRFVPLVQAALNLGVSILLGHFIGLPGIFIGTLVSSIPPFIVKPYLLYKRVFHTSPAPFFRRFALETLYIAFFGVVSYLIPAFLWQPENPVLRLIYRFAVTLIVSVGSFWLLHRKDESTQKLLRRVANLLRRRTRK